MLSTRPALLALTLAALPFAFAGCGLGAAADVGGDKEQSQFEKDSGAGGDKVVVSNPSAGGAPNVGGGTTGSSTGHAGASSAAGAPSGGASSAGGAPTSGGVMCGKVQCKGLDLCCNASCGLCAPKGSACIQIACEPAPTDAGPGTCVNIAPCPSGTTWSTKTCECVPNSACTTDADCHLVDNYCGGCKCLALTKDEKAPACAGNEVACFAAPCMNQTAACVNGACVAKQP